MSLPKFTAIAACDDGGLIGKEGKLPWHCPEDLDHFRRCTEGQVMVMGYTTFLSLPKRTFINRTSLILSKNHPVDHSFTCLEDLKKYYDSHPELLAKTNFVIGGSSTFSLFFAENLIHEAVITHIHGRYEGDTYFPMHYLAGWSKRLLRAGEGFSIEVYRGS